MLREFWNGITGETQRLDELKTAIRQTLFVRANQWTPYAAEGFGIDLSDAITIRNAMIAGIDSTIEYVPTLFERVREDFGKQLDGAILLRDWFGLMHLGALLYAAAYRSEQGHRDLMEKLILVVTLNGHSYVYEDARFGSNVNFESMLSAAGPRTAVFDYLIGRYTHLFGQPRAYDYQRLLPHFEILPNIIDRTQRLLSKDSFPQIVDTWVARATNGS